MNCRNCSEPLSGPYCSTCGQKAVDLGRALENESQLETNFVTRLAQVVFLLVPAFVLAAAMA